MSKLQQYLQQIRTLSGLQNAILRGITLHKKENAAEFFLLTDKTYSAADEQAAAEISQAFLPKGMTARVSVTKRVPDEEVLKQRIYAYIRRAFPAASAFLEEDSVHVELLQSGANFYVEIASGDQSLFEAGKILDSVSAYLSTVFCGSFYGNVKVVERAEEREKAQAFLDEEPEEVEELPTVELRYFPICEYQKIDGIDAPLKQAIYMADCAKAQEGYSVCGTITYVEEIKYVRHNEKTGQDEERTRFSLALTDGTGTLRTTYFPKKATVEKVRGLKVGDKIVITGANEEYKGNTSFKAAKINYGQPPIDFKPVAKKSKPVPKAYHAVFPERYEDFTQAGLFDDLYKPDALKNNVFVVFDLETTGLNNNPVTGRMDKIIEIGAVKMINGEIKEKFASFVACKDRLSREIVELTGIHDEDLIGAPEVDEVMADFYKFADGAILVGHNVEFDYRFVSYYGEQCGYMFEHNRCDTLALAQQVLRGRLANYKLNTVAEHYGFTFNHHRAFEDAAVTAKVFVELVKGGGKLPIDE